MTIFFCQSITQNTLPSRGCFEKTKATCLYESLLLQGRVNTAGHRGGQLQGAVRVRQLPFTVQERRPGRRKSGGHLAHAAAAQQHRHNEATEVSAYGHQAPLREASQGRLSGAWYLLPLPGLSCDCSATNARRARNFLIAPLTCISLVWRVLNVVCFNLLNFTNFVCLHVLTKQNSRSTWWWWDFPSGINDNVTINTFAWFTDIMDRKYGLTAVKNETIKVKKTSVAYWLASVY